jgi:hypothetical protein
LLDEKKLRETLCPVMINHIAFERMAGIGNYLSFGLVQSVIVFMGQKTNSMVAIFLKKN